MGTTTRAVATADTTYTIHAGQRLELTPLRNPLAMAPGDSSPVRIMFDNRPLSGALVKAWHKHNGQLVTIRANTSAQGEVTFSLPFAGDWMVSLVHMIPAPADEKEGVDWDSFWGNLTFHMPTEKILN